MIALLTGVLAALLVHRFLPGARGSLTVVAGGLSAVGAFRLQAALPRLEVGFADTLFALWMLTLVLLFLADAAARVVVSRGAFRSRFRLAIVAFMLSFVGLEAWLRFAWGVHVSPEEQRRGVYTTKFPRIDQMKSTPRQRRYFLYPPHLRATVPFAEGTYELRTNALGLRGPEVGVTSDAGAFRIMSIGDSHTEGYGVSEDEAWPRQLEQALARRVPALSVESINAGVAGSDPVFGSTMLEEVLVPMQPDLVIQAVSSNDLMDICLRGGFERYQPDGSVLLRPGPSWEWLYGLSSLVRHVVHDGLGFDWGLRSVQAAEDCARAARRTLREAIDRSCRLSKSAGFSLVVVINPRVHEIVSGRHELEDLWAGSAPVDAHVLWLRRWFARQGITADNTDEFYFPIDRHHTPRGNHVFAEGVAEHLVAAGLLPEAPVTESGRVEETE